MKFMQLSYDSIVVLSSVYYPTSPLILHHILEIASHLHAAERDHNLRNIVTPMKLKFLKYWEDIPVLYSYAFILYPRANMNGFFNMLQLVFESTRDSYSFLLPVASSWRPCPHPRNLAQSHLPPQSLLPLTLYIGCIAFGNFLY